jgi:hypothetical protein
MKHLLSIVLLLLVVFVPCTYADTITILNITRADITIFPRQGGDGNVQYFFTGPGADLSGVGTTNQTWLSGFSLDGFFAGLFPGSSLNASVDPLFIDLVQGSVSIGGQELLVDPVSSALFTSSIATTSFQFPTNGQSTFTVTLPAFIGPISGFTEDKSFQLELPPGSLTLNFDFVPAQDPFPAYYQFSGGEFVAPTTVPEPATIGLMATGLAGVIGVIRKKRSI